jgi:raffinose/stachyose/melibiose transport system substrate-binding protein
VDKLQEREHELLTSSPLSRRQMLRAMAVGSAALMAGGTVANAYAGSSSAPPKSASTSDQQVTLKFANTWVVGQMNGHTYPLDFVKAFEKAHPNVKVNLFPYNSSDYQNTVLPTMMTSHQFPDLFAINSMDMQSSADAGLLLNLTKFLDADPAWKNSFLPGLFNETTFHGQVYGIPYQFITNEAIYYNKAILRKAGSSAFPTTWEGLLALDAKLKSMGYIPMALGDKGGWPLCSNLMEIMCSYLCGPQWVANIGAFNSKSSYKNPDFVAVLKLIKDAVDNGYFNSDMVSIDNNTQDKAYFFNSKAAMLFGGSYTLPGIWAALPKAMVGNVAVAPIPRPTNAKPNTKLGSYTGGSGWEWALNANLSPAQAQAAIELVKMLTSPTYAADDAVAQLIPVVKLQNVGAYDSAKVPPLQQQLLKSISSAPSIQPMNQQQSNPPMSNVIYKALQELAVNQITPQQAAQNIESTYKQVVAAMKK